ncbi:flagellar FliL protein [Cribrihabitans marinus]|uniref:Flagellar protein FliL n=1 Tax=Cribrihabitans marinus TaxID=1227549 RepID=A0A1H7DK22_9RHOB|nr:flagellar basal body-associated FliL family protein [Cribrihabitans marinus]GGH39409.1 flagellar basal body protein FliL [Cribrihabitans marinus]SEK01267.1 flagellar FliL protein [Cribrihabitans marinus]
MTDSTGETAETPKKSGKSRLILGLLLAAAGAGGGYFATVSGAIPLSAQKGVKPEKTDAPPALADIAYVDLPPILVTLQSGGAMRHLKFHAQLEVESAQREAVEQVVPRILDVLNGYLRALEPGELTEPLALVRLRGQMLRRIAIVAGDGRVRDLLVAEFVLN